jgi:hypothetical protein
MTHHKIDPTTIYASNSPAGPALASAEPVPINNPVPIPPPKPIKVTCRAVRRRCGTSAGVLREDESHKESLEPREISRGPPLPAFLECWTCRVRSVLWPICFVAVNISTTNTWRQSRLSFRASLHIASEVAIVLQARSAARPQGSQNNFSFQNSGIPRNFPPPPSGHVVYTLHRTHPSAASHFLPEHLCAVATFSLSFSVVLVICN